MPQLSSVDSLIDFSENGERIVFHGTEVPVDRLLQSHDPSNVARSVDEFRRQHPEVNQAVAYALLAVAGRYPAFVLESFLSFSPDGVSDQFWGSHVQSSMEEFDVDWSHLVASSRLVPRDELRYLAEIERFGNRADRVVFGRAFELRADAEFERLVDHLLRFRLYGGFAASLLSRTAIHRDLTGFASSPDELSALVTKAQFRRVSPLYMEAELSDYLYHTGIYRRFYEDHAMEDAQGIVRDFLKRTLGSQLRERLCLVSRRPWGKWFDPHSCGDLTLIGVNRNERQNWLLAFSDSD